MATPSECPLCEVYRVQRYTLEDRFREEVARSRTLSDQLNHTQTDIRAIIEERDNNAGELALESLHSNKLAEQVQNLKSDVQTARQQRDREAKNLGAEVKFSNELIDLIYDLDIGSDSEDEEGSPSIGCSPPQIADDEFTLTNGRRRPSIARIRDRFHRVESEMRTLRLEAIRSLNDRIMDNSLRRITTPGSPAISFTGVRPSTITRATCSNTEANRPAKRLRPMTPTPTE